eukprot:15210130-Ditylum_brightwellii.AAC.1
MKTAPISTQNNSDSKRAVIAFQQPEARQLKRGLYHTYKLHTTPADPTSPIYELSVPLQAVLKGQNVMQGPPSYPVTKMLLKGDTLTVFEQAEINHGAQSVPHFELCLDDMTEHVFPEKATQTQKCYMRRNLRLVGEMTVKEWVAW